MTTSFMANALQWAPQLAAGDVVVCTLTGHGLKDAGWALKDENGGDIQPTVVNNNAAEVAESLGLA